MDLCVPAMNAQHAIKVLIRSLDGGYLAGEEGHWRLTPDRSSAVVCDYLQDHVAEQLQRLNMTRGIALVVEPLDPRDAYETCDQCGDVLETGDAHFDGLRFLCPRCQSATNQSESV